MSLSQALTARMPAPKKNLSVPESFLTIGDLAREFGVTLRTLRFYEDRGLLAPHRDGHARFYRERDRARLAQILKAKSLGFTLGEIRDLMASDKANDGRGVLPLKPEQIETQIRHLKRQREEIDAAIGQLSAALASRGAS